MKRLKAGPELKMPDLRVPGFVEDLYYDLKDRRLLPLVALAIVAIVAVPFLLSGGSDKPEPGAASPGGGSASASGAEASLTVVRANPGLRDYRKRLGDRTPTDPFKQHFTAPNLVGAQLGGETGSEAPAVSSTTTSTSTSTTVESTGIRETTTTTNNENGVVRTESESTTSPNSGSAAGNGSGGNNGSTGSEPVYFTFAIDVRVKTAVTAPDGSVEAGKPVNASKLVAPAAIPTEDTPVVTYLGVSEKTGNPVLLVAEEVSSIFGEGKCLSGTQRCQLLEVEVGMPTTFVYGAAGERFKVTVTKVERVDTKLPKPLQPIAESP